MHALKPLDVVVGLKIGLNEQRIRNEGEGILHHPIKETNSVGDLAKSLYKGKGDISRSIKRLQALGLIGERSQKPFDALSGNRKHYAVQRKSMSEFLCYGIRHVFAPEKSGVGRGLPTGWSCPMIDSPMNPPEIPLVWSQPGGAVQGEVLEPLYAGCADASVNDKGLHTLLSLIEVIRVGKPRELGYAKDILNEKVMELHS